MSSCEKQIQKNEVQVQKG